jgi:hypothetical protein
MKGITMQLHFNIRLTGIAAAVVILALLLVVPGLVSDANAGSKNRGRSKIAVTGETPLYPGYPRLFDNVGRIDRITATEAVIDDSLHRISPFATYHAPGYRDALRSRFRRGDVVGCLINAAGEIESIWLISAKNR